MTVQRPFTNTSAQIRLKIPLRLPDAAGDEPGGIFNGESGGSDWDLRSDH